MKIYRACFYRKQNGAAPFYARIVANSKAQATRQAEEIAHREHVRLRSITEIKP